MSQLKIPRAPSTTAIFNRNRDVQPDRGCGCGWWSTHTRSDRSVQSFSVESQFSDSNNVGPRLWWSNRPPNIRKFWSTATETATCKLRWWLRLLEPIHGKFGRGWRWKLRLKIAVVDGALKVTSWWKKNSCNIKGWDFSKNLLRLMLPAFIIN